MTDPASGPPAASPDVRGGTLDGRALAARLPGVVLLDLDVVATEALTPAMRRVQFSGEGLAGFSHQPGQDLMLAVPAAGGATFRRRYTIRHHRSDLLSVDVVLHGDGPGARWAAAAAPGHRLEAIGPRGKVTVVAEADWHLFVGDESALPASLAMAEALPPGATALMALEVAGPQEHQEPESAADVTVQWLHRGAAEPGTSGLLARAVAAMALPAGRGHAYVAGELHEVAAVRQALLGRGLEAEQLSTKPYWRRGVANAAHGEPDRP